MMSSVVKNVGCLTKITVICLAVTVLFFTGCSRQPKEPELETINIAFQKWVGYGPLYLAQEKGLFKDEGMELIFIDESLDSARSNAFRRGMLDCEAGTIDLLVTKRSQDIPVVAVLEIDHSNGSDGIASRKDIQKVEDLIGKRIAFARDNVGETFLSYLFYKRGLSLDDITIIPGMPDDAWKALSEGAADAVVTWEPWLSRAAQMPNVHILISTKEEPSIIIDTLNVREDIVKDNPELVKKLMRGWFKATEYCREHPEEASRIIAKFYDLSPQEYRKKIEGLKWITYEEQLSAEHAKQRLEIFKIISEIKFFNGRIQGKPNVRESINTTLLEELYENSD